jgi:ParB-like chromosome segregation protein Spo0J
MEPFRFTGQSQCNQGALTCPKSHRSARGATGMSKSWRDFLPVHPACAMFDPLAPDELQALGEDIRKNGLTSPIVVWRQPDTTAPGQLLDGRNRLDAMELVGLQVVGDDDLIDVPWIEQVEPPIDPFAYVVSANIRRRHLSIEDKDRLIVQLLKADPTRSNRTVAKLTDTSHPHVAKVREQAEKAGDVETVTTSIDTKGRQQPTKRKPVTEQQVRDKALRNKSEAIKAAQVPADIGPASNSEIARIRTRNEELETENVRLRLENTALRGEIEELKARLLDIPDFLDRTKRTTHPTC